MNSHEVILYIALSRLLFPFQKMGAVHFNTCTTPSAAPANATKS